MSDDYSLVTIRSLSRHLEPTLDVLAAMLSEPLFSDLRVDGIKELMRHLQKMESDDPNALMRKTLAAATFFGSTATARSSSATRPRWRASARRISRLFSAAISRPATWWRWSSATWTKIPSSRCSPAAWAGCPPAGTAARTAAAAPGGATGIGRQAPNGADPYRLRRSAARAQRRKFSCWPRCWRPGWARASAADCGRCATERPDLRRERRRAAQPGRHAA